MKILITGNMGYVGPAVVRRLRESFPDATLVGFDMGYFAHCLTASDILPECRVDLQHVGDVRKLSRQILFDVDAVVHLAAISNDPMGATFEDITVDINYRASVDVARKAKEAGVKAFVFASSCSVYGVADGGPRTEADAVNPLTAYARSKIMAERELAAMAETGFKVTCLRFATACGMTDRLRLDLVLNDFVASAVAAGKIQILSDGSPWRPLIHVKDMARALDWAIQRDAKESGDFLVVNAGSDEWNVQVRDLAAAVAKLITGVAVSINKDAQPDKRSYQVSFKKFKQLAPEFQPEMDLASAIEDLLQGLRSMSFQDKDFRNSRLIRLNMLKQLKSRGLVTDSLEWTHTRKLVEV